MDVPATRATPPGSERVRLGALGAVYRPGRAPAEPVPMLLVHGMWGGSFQWERWQPLLAERGFDTYAIDRPGHHPDTPLPSGVPLGRVSIDHSVAAVRDAARALGRPVLIGHSLGGLIALKAAERAELAAVVALAPGAPHGVPMVGGPALMASMARYVPAMARRRAFRPTRATFERLVFNRLSAGEADREYAGMIDDSGLIGREVAFGAIRLDGDLIGAPILCVSGAQDRLAPRAMVARVAAKVGAQHRVYPDQGHLLMREPGHELVAAEVAGWVEQRLAELPSLRPVPSASGR